MIDHQKRVLDMLSEGKISVHEAERLLAALGQTSDVGAGAGIATATEIRRHEHVSVVVETNDEATADGAQDESLTVGDSPTLIVNGYNARVVVKAGADNTIRLQATLKHPSRIDYRVEQDGDVVRVSARRKARTSLFDFLGNAGHVEIIVATPRDTKVEIESSNASIELTGVEGGGEMRTSNGKIVMQNVKGDLRASTSNSRIELRDMEGSAALNTSNARIVMDAVEGIFDATTSNGSISFKGQMKPGGSNRLRTSNGGVSIKLEGDPSLMVDASTSNGHVTSNLPALKPHQESKRQIVGTIGDGEAELLVRSSNGSISIE